jgi:hypothetical protein
MRDPYDVLGVPRSADAAAIKSAFRRLAKKLHPDANKTDPKAAQRFGELNSAYEILGDDGKRKAFDRGEIDADGKPRFKGFEGFRSHPGGGFRNAEEFETIFPGGGGAFRRGRARVSGFEDVLKGMFGGAPAGTGFDPHSTGTARRRDVTVPVTISLAEAAKGGAAACTCRTARRDVKIRRVSPTVSNPPQRQGLGQARSATRHRHDRGAPAVHARGPICGSMPIALYEAVLGAKVQVPSTARSLQFRRHQQRPQLRLRAGLPGRRAGDLLAKAPCCPTTDGARRLMRKWRDANPYDPRKDWAERSHAPGRTLGCRRPPDLCGRIWPDPGARAGARLHAEGFGPSDILAALRWRARRYAHNAGRSCPAGAALRIAGISCVAALCSTARRVATATSRCAADAADRIQRPWRPFALAICPRFPRCAV